MKEIEKGIYFSSHTQDMDLEIIYGFLKTTFWGKSRTFQEQKLALENSINFGLFIKGKQVAYARVMTDKVFFAYLLDVFVLEEYRGKGLSKLLMDEILKNSELKNVDKWMLATKDTHGLYKQYGFETVKNPLMLMEKMSDRAKKIYL